MERTPNGSLANLLAWRVQDDPDRAFLHVEDEGPWTYGQLAAASAEVARRLAELPSSDLVVVRLGNDERFVAATFGIWSAGGAAIAMHPATPIGEAIRAATLMGASALICDPTDPIAASDALQIPLVTLDRIGPGDAGGGEVLAVAERAPAVASYHIPSYRIPSDDVGGQRALVLLTSGSTGEPKGVVLTHNNAWSNLRATAAAFRRETGPGPLAKPEKPPNLIANPLSHTAGIVRLLFALYVGRSVVLMRKFDGRTAKGILDRHNIDNLTINPSMMRILLEALEPGEDLGAVRYVSSGTAPLPPALRDEFEGRFRVPVLQAYGQTEAFGGIAIENASDVLAGRRRPGSVGRPLPGVEVRLVAADGTEAAVGEEGEIRVRSSSATSGYLGRDADQPLDEQGWLRTGDLGRMDADGYLYITGRLKNLIIRGGFNVVPEEVEAALEEDPSVREAVVVGVPDERLGEVPVALILGAMGDGPTGDAVRERVRDRLTPYKMPTRVFVADELPRVANGKVDRRRVTDLAIALLSGSEAPESLSADGVATFQPPQETRK